jgi:hypothetical protein
MRFRLLLLGGLLAVCGLLGALAAGLGQRVIDLGPQDTTQLAQWFGSDFTLSPDGGFGIERTSLESGILRSPTIMVRFPAGSSSNLSHETDGTPLGGAQAYLPMSSGPADEMHLRYCVRFPEGFDFVKGGKLPGLYGGTVTSGQHIPDGANGFSTRLMWRASGAGEVYAYLPGSIQHGTSIGRGTWTFRPGSWDCIEQQVTLNTPGKSDGQIVVWANGCPVIRESGLVFRTTGRLRIDGLFFSTFFGGSDRSWSTPVDQHVEFSDFQVSPHPVGSDGLPGPLDVGQTLRELGSGWGHGAAPQCI